MQNKNNISAHSHLMGMSLKRALSCFLLNCSLQTFSYTFIQIDFLQRIEMAA